MENTVNQAMEKIIENLEMDVNKILQKDSKWKGITSHLSLSIEQAVEELRGQGHKIPDLLEEGNMAPGVYEMLVARVTEIYKELKSRENDKANDDVEMSQ